MDRKPPGRPRLSVDPLAQINIRLTQEQLEWLDAEETRLGRVGRNAVVRMLIEREMSKTAGQTPKKANGTHYDPQEITKM